MSFDPDVLQVITGLTDRLKEAERRLKALESVEYGRAITTLPNATIYAPNITNLASPSYVATWDNSTGRIHYTALTSVTTPYARIRSAAVQSIPNATGTVITFDTEIEDTNAFVDLATFNTRITVPTGLDGIYAISGNIRFATAATATIMEVAVRVNASISIASEIIGGGSDRAVSCATVRRLAAGDYLDMTVYHNNGAALNTSVVIQYSPVLAIAWLGA